MGGYRGGAGVRPALVTLWIVSGYLHACAVSSVVCAAFLCLNAQMALFEQKHWLINHSVRCRLRNGGSKRLSAWSLVEDEEKNIFYKVINIMLLNVFGDGATVPGESLP